MQRHGFTKVFHLAVLTGLALSLVTTSAFGAKIQGGGIGKWSELPWPAGVVPGANDDVLLLGVYNNIIYDTAAPGAVRSISGNSVTLTLAADLTAENLYLREGTIADGGKKLTVTGTLSNALGADNSGNGLIRTGQGGNLVLNNLVLGRTGLFTFYPGDTISGTYTTYSTFNTWPDVTVTQDTSAYSGQRAKGLSLENDAPGALVLGRTSATNQAEITLNWDSGMTGAIDWTLRWKGDHVAALRAYYANGQIITKTQPAGIFNPTDNIFFDSATGYTYVGFTGSKPLGLIHYWPGDGNGKDVVGTANAILGSTTSFGAGQVGQAFSFDGAQSSVVTLPVDINPDTYPQLTIGMRVNLRKQVAGNGWIMGHDDGGYDRALIVQDSRYALGVAAGSGSPYSSTLVKLTQNLGTWHCIAVAYDQTANQATVYADGNVQAIATKLSTGVRQATLGGLQNYPNHTVDALVNGVFIFNRRLSKEEIDMTCSVGFRPATAAGYYAFQTTTTPQDRESELRSLAGGVFTRIPGNGAGKKFSEVCQALTPPKMCKKVVAWDGSELSCDNGAEDGSRMALCGSG